jgi:hypothetical protein
MTAYNFQKQFAALVESGVKRQTIRADNGRRHVRPGEALQLYTGRGPNCRKMVTPDPICLSVERCYIGVSPDGYTQITVNGRRVNDIEAFARADGFESFAAMESWFRKNHNRMYVSYDKELRFYGVLIKW